MDKSKIIVLDFIRGEVIVYDYDLNIWGDAIEFLESEEIGLNSNNCQWMIVDKLNIRIK